MATKKVVKPVQFSITQRVGIAAGELPEAQPGIVQGFRMSRREELVELRREINVASIEAGTQQLIAEAKARLAELS